ncbi:MAG TPA: DUF4258 domain-containing protein [Bacteroidia bacterium]|nr:DUF4258 domain-containing protein [Bacteroidia bacterium]HNT80043.1 DUF4258 domain-containing protein [Bacteroidia bacterium]
MGIRFILFSFLFACGISLTACKDNAEVSENHTSDFRTKKIVYTKHATCRMECRNIDEQEVEDMVLNGIINEKKSDPRDEPCPSIALEGITQDQQEVRIVVANCDEVLKVITVIDLEREYNCNCY